MNPEKSLFEIFADNESKIAELYAIYSSIFPDQKVWDKLSKEEVKHAAILRNLDEQYGQSQKIYSVIDNGRRILDYVGAFIDQKIVEAKSGELTAKQAIDAAMRLELSVVERKCFDIFNSDEEEIVSALKKLNRDTQNHFERLKPLAKTDK